MDEKQQQNQYEEQLYQYILKLISIRPRSIQEAASRLTYYSRKKGIPVRLIQKVIDDLIAKNLLNDHQFCLWWIEKRDTLSPKGSMVIERELRSKGIDRDMVEHVLSEVQNEREGDLELALKSMGKRLDLYKKLPKIDAKKKITGFLSRRGFEYNVIDKVVDWIDKKSYNNDEVNLK